MRVGMWMAGLQAQFRRGKLHEERGSDRCGEPSSGSRQGYELWPYSPCTRWALPSSCRGNTRQRNKAPRPPPPLRTGEKNLPSLTVSQRIRCACSAAKRIWFELLLLEALSVPRGPQLVQDPTNARTRPSFSSILGIWSAPLWPTEISKMHPNGHETGRAVECDLSSGRFQALIYWVSGRLRHRIHVIRECRSHQPRPRSPSLRPRRGRSLSWGTAGRA